MPVPTTPAIDADLSPETKTRLRKAVEEGLQPSVREAHRVRDQALSKARRPDERAAADEVFEQTMVTLRATATDKYKRFIAAFHSGSPSIEDTGESSQAKSPPNTGEQDSSGDETPQSSPPPNTTDIPDKEDTTPAPTRSPRSPRSRPLSMSLDDSNVRSQIKREVEDSLSHLVSDAQREREEALSRAQTDGERERAYQGFKATMDSIKMLAVEEYRRRLYAFRTRGPSGARSSLSTQPDSQSTHRTSVYAEDDAAGSGQADEQGHVHDDLEAARNSQALERMQAAANMDEESELTGAPSDVLLSHLREAMRKREQTYDAERREMIQRVAALEGIARTRSEIQRREAEVDIMAEEMQRKEEEFRRRSGELRRMETEAKKKVEEVTRRHEETLKKEEDMMQREWDARERAAAVEHMEEEIRQKEDEAKLREDILRKKAKDLERQEDSVLRQAAKRREQPRNGGILREEYRRSSAKEDRRDTSAQPSEVQNSVAQKRRIEQLRALESTGEAQRGAQPTPENQIDYAYLQLCRALQIEADEAELEVLQLEDECGHIFDELESLEAELVMKKEEAKRKERELKDARDLMSAFTRGDDEISGSAQELQPPIVPHQDWVDEQTLLVKPRIGHLEQSKATTRDLTGKGQKARDRIQERRLRKEAEKEVYNWFK